MTTRLLIALLFAMSLNVPLALGQPLGPATQSPTLVKSYQTTKTANGMTYTAEAPDYIPIYKTVYVSSRYNDFGAYEGTDISLSEFSWYFWRGLSCSFGDEEALFVTPNQAKLASVILNADSPLCYTYGSHQVCGDEGCWDEDWGYSGQVTAELSIARPINFEQGISESHGVMNGQITNTKCNSVTVYLSQTGHLAINGESQPLNFGEFLSRECVQKFR